MVDKYKMTTVILVIVLFCILAYSALRDNGIVEDTWDSYRSSYSVVIEGEDFRRVYVPFPYDNLTYELEFWAIRWNSWRAPHPRLTISVRYGDNIWSEFVSPVLNVDYVKSWDDGRFRIKITDVDAFVYDFLEHNYRLGFLVRYDIYVRGI